MMVRIWHVLADYSGNGYNTVVAFRVSTLSENGKRKAIQIAKESSMAKILQLKNFRTSGVESGPSEGLLDWSAPQPVKNRYYKLRSKENAAFLQEVRKTLRKSRSRKHANGN